jgi:hypothetical protein
VEQAQSMEKSAGQGAERGGSCAEAFIVFAREKKARPSHQAQTQRVRITSVNPGTKLMCLLVWYPLLGWS